MAHEYTPRHFLRLAPNGLLKAYFARRDELTSLGWLRIGDSDKKKRIIYDAWQGLPPDRVLQIEGEFRAIFALATEEGARIMHQEAAILDPKVATELAGCRNLVHKAFWLFLKYPDLFAHVSRCDHTDHLSSRSWKTRKGMPSREPNLGEEALMDLAADVGRFYWEKEGRGEHCRAEAFMRSDNRVYVFVYTEDYASTFIGFDEEGTFIRMQQQPAFEIVFAYDSAGCVLDLYVKGDKRLKRKLEEIFAHCILGVNMGPEPPDNDAYRLDRLKKRGFPLPTDPQDNIVMARIKTLRFLLPERDGLLVVDTPADAKASEAIYDSMDRFLLVSRLSQDSVRVGSATFQVILRRTNTGRLKNVEFNISPAGARNINRDRPEDRLARKYLKLWGVLCA